MKLFRKLIGKGLLCVCGVLLAAFAFSGCATSQEPLFTSTPDVDDHVAKVSSNDAGTNLISLGSLDSDVVKFQVGDLVILSFSDTPEPILPHEERIKEDGNVTLPLVGAVKALGKTAGELQKDIHDRYVPKYYVRLTVTVKGVYTDMFYYVTGEVRAPGPKNYIPATTVTKAISAAGGLTEFANKKNLVLTRANGTRINVNYNKAVESPSQDPKIFPGDSIHVKKSIW